VHKPFAKTAQVYIATTTGLVQVQSLKALADPTLSSMMTINKSVHVSGVSQDYALLVDSPQGIIKRYFGEQAFRLNVASQIDVGNSWQLAVFLSHILAKNEALTEQDGDIIFIATGALDTENDRVQSISALGRKCLAAKLAIDDWQQRGKEVYFFVPSENYKQPLPDVAIPLTPVSSIEQFVILLQNIIQLSPLSPVSSLPTMVSGASLTPSSEKRVNILAAQDLEHKAEPARLFETSQQSWYQRINKGFWSAVLALSFATILVFYYQWQLSAPALAQYNMQAFISEDKADCGFASKQIVGQGEFLAFNQVQALQYKHVCALRLNTSTHIRAVWLISPENNIVVLSPKRNDAEDKTLALRWDIPALEVFMSDFSHSKSYYLVGFTETVDAADKQALHHYLQQGSLLSLASHPSQASQAYESKSTLQALNEWSYSVGYSLHIIQQNLP